MRSTSFSFLVGIGGGLLLLGLGWGPSARAQSTRASRMAAYDFQTYQPHPYVHALGNATVAARGSPGAIGMNPATIGTAGAVRVGSNVNLRRGPVYSSPRPLPPFGDPLIRGRWITAPSGTVQIGRWAAGLQIKHFSQSIGSGNDGVSIFDQSVKLAAAYNITPRISLGAGVNLIRRRLITSLEADLPFSPGTNGTTAKTEDRTHLTVDLGLHYETRIERGIVALRPAFGLSLTDFGGNVPVKDVRGKQLSLGRKKLRGDRPSPMMIRGGGALQVVSQSQRFGRPEWRIGLYGALSNLLVSGETVEGSNGVNYYEADGPFSTLLNGWGQTKALVRRSGELVSVTVGPWERIRKHAGLEVSVLDVFSLRLGRFHESDKLEREQYTAVGFGLDAYYVALDTSWRAGDDERQQDLSYTRLTVRIPLSESPRNFWPTLLGND